MSDKNAPAFQGNSPAFPCGDMSGRTPYHGLTTRALAAILLCVPDSGEEWLDSMIRRAQADRIAATGLAGMLANSHALIKETERLNLVAPKFCRGVPAAQLERATAENVGLAELVGALQKIATPHPGEDMAIMLKLCRQTAQHVLRPFTGDDNG